MTRSPIRKMLTPLATAKMQTAMQTLPCSLDALVLVTGLAKPVVTRYVKELVQSKLVHVAAWDRDSRGYPTIRQFKWGYAPDVVCPRTARTSTDRMREQRAAQKGL